MFGYFKLFKRRLYELQRFDYCIWIGILQCTLCIRSAIAAAVGSRAPCVDDTAAVCLGAKTILLEL